MVKSCSFCEQFRSGINERGRNTQTAEEELTKPTHLVEHKWVWMEASSAFTGISLFCLKSQIFAHRQINGCVSESIMMHYDPQRALSVGPTMPSGWKMKRLPAPRSPVSLVALIQSFQDYDKLDDWESTAAFYCEEEASSLIISGSLPLFAQTLLAAPHHSSVRILTDKIPRGLVSVNEHCTVTFCFFSVNMFLHQMFSY